jgi:collagenase-like PrtC family protease
MNNPKTQLVVPCHWDYNVLDILAKQNADYKEQQIGVTDMYGGLPGESIGNGRSPNKVARLTRTDAITFRKAVEERKIKFNYLLNNSLPFTNSPSMQQVHEYLDWIVGEFKPDALVIASKDLMKIVRERYGSIPIHISTIAGISSVEDLERFRDINPSKVVVHNDLARDFSSLEETARRAAECGIDIELMVTESCLRKCPYMKEHRDHISRGGDDSNIQCSCNMKKLSYPYEILRANFVRPEDLAFYEEKGISSFKISGRSKPASWLPLATEAYMCRNNYGNLISLLGIDPNLYAEEWIFISNKALDGFIDSFPRTGSSDDEADYCKMWAVKLFKKGDFRIRGISYKIDNGDLTCTAGLSEFKHKYYPDAK